MRKFLGPAVALLLTSALQASAADLPSMKAPLAPPPPVYSWTGFYIGGDIGGLWTDAKYRITSITPNIGTALSSSPVILDNSQFRGGGYVGFNWQVAPSFVLGVEGDFGGLTKKNATFYSILPNTFIGGLGFVPGGFGDATSLTEKWDGSVRGKVGYLYTPNMLAYITGGVSWLRFQGTVSCGFQTCGTPFTVTQTSTRTGWTVGYGMEWMFAPNWIAKAEYRYSDYGRYTAGVTFPGLGGGSGELHLRTSTGLVGVAYQFSWFSPGPVVAKY